MKYKIETVKIKIPKGADEKSLDKKIGRWANQKAYGIAWSVREGIASVDFHKHTGLLREDPKEFGRACKVLNRIVANSAPKPEPTWTPAPPKWTKRLCGHSSEQDPEIYFLELPTMSANKCPAVIQIQVHRNYRGSPAHCFNGADDWPHLTLRIPFQVGEEPKRLAFVQKLQKFIEENL